MRVGSRRIWFYPAAAIPSHSPPDHPLRDTDSWMAPTEVSFRLSPCYGIRTAREAHDWFLVMMQQHEELEVETDEPGEWPVPFSSETVRRVVVE